jgi:hypothetical protein
MCDPLSASLAMTAAGTYAQYEGQKKANDAMGKAGLEELNRQKGFREQSTTAFNESLGKNSAQSTNKSMDEQYNRYKNAAESNIGASAATGAGIASKGATPQIVSDEGAARSFTARNSATQNARNAAMANAFGNSMIGTNFENARSLQDQAMLANFMKGSASVLPYETQAASHAGDDLKGIGTGLNTAASVLGMYGAMQPATAAAAAPATVSTANVPVGTQLSKNLSIGANGAQLNYIPDATQFLAPGFKPGGLQYFNGSGMTFQNLNPSWYEQATNLFKGGIK